MNEFFAADPQACANEGDLRSLLRLFGPYTGRYLAMYPLEWQEQLHANLKNLKVVEEQRVRTLLRRAREQAAIVAKPGLPWNANLAWLRNAAPLTREPKTFDSLVATVNEESAAIVAGSVVYSIHDLADVAPTAEERILAEPAEYARVAKTLLLISDEVAVVDPYLDPSKKRAASVLLELFRIAARGKTKKLTLWSRYSLLVGSANPKIALNDAHHSLQQLFSKAHFPADREVELVLVRDEDTTTKLHERYLLSIKGGIRFDQGFQQLPVGRRMTVSPISKIVHDELLGLFFERDHAFDEVARLSVPIKR